MKKIILTAAMTTLLSLTAMASEHHGKHWNYSDNGPAVWGEFSKTCETGKSQSPINIISNDTVAMDQNFDLHLYEDVSTTAEVIDNGHSIKITPEAGGKMKINGQTFNLLQFHFHGKSENTVNGKRYELVSHMVHQNPKTKQLAVVAVLFEEGKNNPLLDNILSGVGHKVRLNPRDLLPENTTNYYHFSGSLTTPPCSENVQWYVLKTPVTASKSQIEAFRKYYDDNERPVQKLNGRKVESN